MFIFNLIDIIFQALNLALIARVMLSWIPHDPYHPIVEWIIKLTDPIMKPFQKLIPPIAGMDISPIFAFIALGIIKQLIIKVLIGF